DDAVDLFDRLLSLGRLCMKRRGIVAKKLDLDRLGCTRKVPDHVGQDTHEFCIQGRLRMLDLTPDIVDHSGGRTVTTRFHLDRKIACIRLRDTSETELKTGAP